ncbi:Glycosyltransferase family 2 [uncultured virus]|nr:Glycosyltransferase family 2 [uncultured virus]
MPQRRKVNIRQQKQQELKDRLRKKLAVKHGPKKVCVVGIMKNESKNVDRLLDSLLPLPPDMVSIVDTGSTDDTEEKILAWGEKNNIPTAVHHEPFKNFTHNRTHSIRAAKEAFPDADYFLLTDADFVWEINKGGKFDKTLLVDHKYLIEQYNKALSYWNIRLLSAKVDWICEGVTHEYWGESKTQTEYSGEVRTTKIKTLAIDDREDGGCKSDKFERDERLLRAGLDDKDTPNHLKTRYKFYLAQTLKDMGRYDESIEWYTKRTQDRGWAEEVYYAKFQIGFNHEQLGWKKKHAVSLMGKAQKTEEDLAHLAKWNPENIGPADLMQQSTKHFTDAGVNYMAAYNFRKTRVEALYYLTRMYRMLGMNEMAYNLAQIGKKVIYPEEDTLFIERACYDYLFDFEVSIVAFYLKEHKDEGREAVSRLIQRDDLPQWIVETIENNSRHYI